MSGHISSYGYAATDPKSQLVPFAFKRRELLATDILINIEYCGVCHSDVHQVRDEWGGSIYPMVPGHEIVGKVAKIGSVVKNFKVGDLAGVGCLVDSCRKCESCKEGLEQYCENGMVGTYNSVEKDGKTPTYGGYSNLIVVSEKYALKIPGNLDLAGVAPLLCAGITTYSPLRHWKVTKGNKVGVVGLGGLGHMAVKFAHSFGAEVVVFTTSESKIADAKKLGADQVVLSKSLEQMQKHKNSFDFIIDTVSASHDLNAYLALLTRDGTMTLVGLPEEPPQIQAFQLVPKRRSLAGSMIGGIAETQEMLDYCGKQNIISDVEIIPIQKINEAYGRLVKGDVKYRFVIDLKSLRADSL
jgi:uncharacterized zinc-type alcohol dehydrogenase-like protein